jgi:predicted component of viral defense system (DUF524 family)
MIDKNNILKMVNDVFHRSQGYPDRRLLHPHREWSIGVFMFVVVVVAGSVFVTSIFMQYKDVSSTEEGLEESIPQYREVIVQDALELYRARTEEYQQLRGEVISVSDEATNSADTSTDGIDSEVEESSRVPGEVTGGLQAE